MWVETVLHLDKSFEFWKKSNIGEKKEHMPKQPEWLKLGKFLDGTKLEKGWEIEVELEWKQIKFILTKDGEFLVSLKDQKFINEIKIDENVSEVRFFRDHLFYKIEDKNQNSKREIIVSDGEQVDLTDLLEEVMWEIYYNDLFKMLNDTTDVWSDEN